MSVYLTSKKWIRILLFICVSSLLSTALAGSQDFKKEGVACTFQARIVGIQTPPSGTKALVVQELPTTTAMAQGQGQPIYVLVTPETISRFGDRILKFNDFRRGMLLEIQGLKVIERDNGQDNTFVLALKIRRLIG